MALSTATVSGVGLADDAGGLAGSASTSTTVGTGAVAMGVTAAPIGLVAAVAAALVAGGPGLVAAFSLERPRLHGGSSELAAAGPGVCIGIPVPFPGGGPLALDVVAAMPLLVTGAVGAGGGGGLAGNDQRLFINAFTVAGSPIGAGGPEGGGASSPGAAIASRANNTGKAKRMAATHGRRGLRRSAELFQTLQQTWHRNSDQRSVSHTEQSSLLYPDLLGLGDWLP